MIRLEEKNNGRKEDFDLWLNIIIVLVVRCEIPRRESGMVCGLLQSLN